jgi:ornithine decarboxylase
MMKGRNGFHLWNEATRVAVETRKNIRRLPREFEARSSEGDSPPWFFDPFVPDVVTITGSPHTADLHDVPWEDVPTGVLLAEQQCWLLGPGAGWHGFEQVTDGYAMTDPNKLTLVTSGFSRETGEYLDWGVPAPVLAEFLRERGIVPEKNDLNTVLFLVTPGIEVSKAGTLITTLVDFKRFFDSNVPLREVLPKFVAAIPHSGTGRPATAALGAALARLLARARGCVRVESVAWVSMTQAPGFSRTISAFRAVAKTVQPA